MGKLNEKEVNHLAKLANLKLSPKEIKKFSGQLSDVVDYFDTLKQVDTDNVEPTAQTTGLTDNLRTDEIKSDQILSAEEALSGTDKIHNNYFKVPAILNNE